MDINWYDVQCRAFTEIRGGFRVVILKALAEEEGNDTPVCGDTLATRFKKVS